MVKAKFLEIACPRCGKKHIVYGKATSRIKCESCNYLLIKPRGGKAKVRARINELI